MVCPHCGQPNPYKDTPQTIARDSYAIVRDTYALVLEGKRIEAIKLARERMGLDYEEAKNFVELLKG
jgi:ribosomal protein L7/L12